MGRLYVYIDFTRVFDVFGEKLDRLYTFIRFHRGFCMISVQNLSISMFIRYHRGFRCVLTRFSNIFSSFFCVKKIFRFTSSGEKYNRRVAKHIARIYGIPSCRSRLRVSHERRILSSSSSSEELLYTFRGCRRGSVVEVP